MKSLLKLLAFPLLSLVFLILGVGFFTTFVSVRLDLAGISSETIGLITAAFYAGVLLASIRAPSWIHRFGHLKVWIALCSGNALFTMLHFLWIDPIYWLFLRFFSGIFLGGFYVVIESWFLLLCPSSQRSLTLSIYIFVYYLATSTGQIFMNCNPYSFTPYLLAGVLSALAIIPCVMRTFPVPKHAPIQGFSFIAMIRACVKGFFGGFVSGMILACVYGLAPLFGQKIGLTIPQIGWMMSVIIFGGLVFQIPLGKWADAWSRRRVMMIACFASALLSALVPLLEESRLTQLLFLGLFGGFSFALYPLSMSYTCEKMPEHQIVAVAGGFNVTYGVGAIVGPLLAPLFMDGMGPNGLFYFIAIISFITGLVGWKPRKNSLS